MNSDLSIIIMISLLGGASLAALVWGCRGWIVARFNKDVRWLEQAVWRFTPDPFNGRPYVAGYYAFSLVALAALLYFMPVKIVAVFFWLFLLWLPRQIIEMRWEKRRKKIDLQLGEAVMRMAANVSSGMTLSQAIQRVAEQVEQPIKTEFEIMANYWRMGADLQASIEEARRRLRLPNFNLFASALLVNQKMGGNVVDTLERLGGSIEGIERMRQEIHAATAEGRMNIKVIGSAPLLMLGIISLMDFEAVTMLFTKPVGLIVLGACAALAGGGMIWAWSIVNSDV